MQLVFYMLDNMLSKDNYLPSTWQKLRIKVKFNLKFHQFFDYKHIVLLTIIENAISFD